MLNWERLGDILREEVKKKGLRWTHIQKQTGFASNTISDLFKDPGRRKLDTLAKIAQILGIPLSELIRRAEEPIPQEESPPEPKFDFSICAELREKVLFPLSEGKKPLWTLKGLKGHISACPHCQKNLGKLRSKKLSQEEEEVLRFLHFVGAEPVRCPFCGAVVSVFQPDRFLACPECMSLYVVDPSCDVESSSHDLADLLEKVPGKIAKALRIEDVVLHNVVLGYCHFKELASDFDVRFFAISDWLEVPHPGLIHLHFFRFKTKKRIKGSFALEEGRNISIFLLTLF